MTDGTTTEGARTYTLVTREAFEEMASNVGSGYYAANRLVEAIEDGLTESLVGDLRSEGVHAVGVEFMVDASVEDGDGNRPFAGLTGGIGLSVMWFLPEAIGPTADDAGPGGPASIRAIAVQSTEGPKAMASTAPGANLADDEVGTEGVLFVAHHTGTLADVDYESWYEDFETASVGAGIDRGLISEESFGGPVPYQMVQPAGGGIPLAWYCFGASLDLTGSVERDASTPVTGWPWNLWIRYHGGRYEHLRWLLWRLGLASRTGEISDPAAHDFIEFVTPESRRLRPVWSSSTLRSGTFAVAENCRTYVPASGDAAVIDGMEYVPSEDIGPDLGTVSNWSNEGTVYHFVNSPPSSHSLYECRPLSDLTQFVLHETGGGTTWEYGEMRDHDRNLQRGIHLTIHESGAVQFHNDLVDRLFHAGTLNENSFGVEIVNPAQEWEGQGVDEDRRIPNVPYVGGDDVYARPTHAQLETTAYLAGWFSTVDRHGLPVDDTWIGFKEDLQDGSETRDGFAIDAEITGAAHTDTGDSGIWAHSYHSGRNKIDGLFPGLYTWLRLEANGGDGLDADDALDAAEELVDEDEGDHFTVGRFRFVDVGTYTD